MKHLIYKLKFPGGIHIGSGRLSSAEMTVHADTLFSAMCIEGLKTYGEEGITELVNAVNGGRLLMSDALPYIGDTLYFPKPMCRFKSNDESADLKKEFKNLKYIPFDSISAYMSGNINPVELNNAFSSLGKNELHQKVSLKAEEDNELYSVGVYRFEENCGLYIIVCVSDEETEKLFDSIMSSLQYSGIGGKRTSGYGRFSYSKQDFIMPDMPDGMYMTLSSCMAEDDELEEVLKNASYKLIKRSGFVQSETYSDAFLKKHDFYLFDACSVFGEKFDGGVFDVSVGGSHPVYKYAKPVFVRIGGGV